jgi:hypothetical protein
MPTFDEAIVTRIKTEWDDSMDMPFYEDILVTFNFPPYLKSNTDRISVVFRKKAGFFILEEILFVNISKQKNIQDLINGAAVQEN